MLLLANEQTQSGPQNDWTVLCGNREFVGCASPPGSVLKLFAIAKSGAGSSGESTSGGRIADARQIAKNASGFPIYLTRSLEQARGWLSDIARGNRRCGLVASSGARRLRADGLGVTLSADDLSNVANWYLLPKGDIRSSYALEVTANGLICRSILDRSVSQLEAFLLGFSVGPS
jgi:hypothetical protein